MGWIQEAIALGSQDFGLNLDRAGKVRKRRVIKRNVMAPRLALENDQFYFATKK